MALACRTGEEALDYLLIESSGISEPMLVAETFEFEVGRSEGSDRRAVQRSIQAGCMAEEDHTLQVGCPPCRRCMLTLLLCC